MIFLFLTSAFSYFLCLHLFTKCLIRKIATEYFRSEERKRIKGLKEAIHECGGKVMPLFNFSMANDSNFFICHFTLMSPRQYSRYFCYTLNHICYMLFVVLSVFLYTYLSVKYLKLALYNSSNWVQYLWPLFIFFCRFSLWKSFLVFQLPTQQLAD